MSYDRTCRMSDLNALESRVRSQIAEAESAAHRAVSRISAIDQAMTVANRRVDDLVSGMDHLSDTVADNRQRLHALNAEIVNLQLEQQQDRARIEENQRMLANLRNDVTILEHDTAANRQAIEQVRQHAQVLQRESDLAKQRIARNEQHIVRLDSGMQRINAYLTAERQRQEAERAAKLNDLDAQARLASELQAQIDSARARFFGLYNEYLSATTMIDQAEQNRRRNNLETAISQYQNAQTILLKVARDADEREKAFENKRALCYATLQQLGNELALVGNQDMQTWYPLEFAQVRQRFEQLQTAFAQKQYEAAGEPVEVRLALEQMSNQGMQIYQDVRLIENKLAETVARHQERKARVRDIMASLRKIWDQNFEYDLAFLNPSDPKSTLKLQTKRPHAPNVTVYLDLDRTIQFSWTGYEGMKCVEDINRFEQVMQEQQRVQIELASATPRPDNPNPPFDGGSGGVVIEKAPPAPTAPGVKQKK